jgi:hypothetical protein
MTELEMTNLGCLRHRIAPAGQFYEGLPRAKKGMAMAKNEDDVLKNGLTTVSGAVNVS